MKYLLLVFIGVSAGVLVAGGLFALLSKVGVITRMLAVSGTGKQCHIYEKVIVLGGVWGDLISIFHIPVFGGRITFLIYGFMSGVFTGALSIALAECINVLPILLGKMGLKKGIPWIVFSFALGKMMGSLYQLV